MYITHLLICFILLAASIGAAPASSADDTKSEIVVSAASSVKNAFEEIGGLFQSNHKGVTLYFNFGGSGDLKRQIMGGAPVDVFASASQKDMDDLERDGFIERASRSNFATNKLVLVRPATSTVPLSSFEDLKRGDVKRIALGNPATVPAGFYAKETLTRLGLWESLKDKFVMAESVRQALDYAARAEVDAGIVFVTDALLRGREVRVVATAEEKTHSPIIYPIAVTRGSSHASLARDFVSLVLSKEGQAILKRRGFSAAGR
jgi:molybdate transport system substrate-binding protein